MSLACIYCGSETHGYGACTAFAERDAEITRLRAELAEMTARRDYWRLESMRNTSELVAAAAELAEARKAISTKGKS